MLHHADFHYRPAEFEREQASNSYLMSMVALMAGLPLPIVNLIATGIFYLGNRKATHFVRWHCTQALLSQVLLFIVNAITIGWLIYIFQTPAEFTNAFWGWVVTALLINLGEFIITIYSAVVVRKGRHVEWWVLGPMTNEICPD